MNSGKNPYNPDTIYERIKKARENAGFVSNEKLAAASDGKLKSGTISKWKHKKAIPQVEQLMIVCNLCKCDIDYLLGRIETFKSENHTIHEEIGLSEDIIELLRAERQRSKNSVNQLESIFEAPIEPHSTRIQLVESVIHNWDSIADNIDFINAYRFHTIALDGFDIDMMVKACQGIHNTISDEFERWQAFRDYFWNEYGRNKYKENSIYHIYMHICNSHAIDAARFSISQELNGVIDKLIESTSEKPL